MVLFARGDKELIHVAGYNVVSQTALMEAIGVGNCDPPPLWLPSLLCDVPTTVTTTIRTRTTDDMPMTAILFRVLLQASSFI